MKINKMSADGRATGLSVRFRILSLSLITAVGLLVLGGVFWWSQDRVAQSFSTLSESASLSRHISDVAQIIDRMRNIEKGYLAQPGDLSYAAFGDQHTAALAALDEIAKRDDTTTLGADLADLRDTLEGVSGAFDTLNGVQATIGFDSESGLRGTLVQTAGEVQTRLKKEMNFGGTPDTEKLFRAILEIQLAEREYVINRNDVALGNFEVAFGRYERLVKKAYMPNEIKDEISTKMQVYREAFDSFTAADLEKGKSVELLENLFDLLPPRLEALNNSARAAELQAQSDLDAIRTFSTGAVMLVILGLLIGLSAAALLIGRSIAVPLGRLSSAMEALASGQTDIELPEAKGSREIAAMAATVSVFRDNAVERQSLALASEAENAQRDARVANLEQLISNFEGIVDRALHNLDHATDELVQTSVAVEAAADDVADQAGEAGNAVRVAAENVNSAASAAEELAASINEIASQASKSTEVAKKAVASAQDTSRTMDQLSSAADRIGQVMGLIRDIANQTNLLALNATIEAARAGEAGKGFAVVAAEVKQLADQTSKATEDIANQVEAIQGSSSQALSAISEVSGIITEMEGLASAVASAVVQQDAAVQSIARNVSDASSRSDEGATRMGAVAGATDHARATGAEVERLAKSLAEQAGLIRREVSSFLTGVRAA
ncbi:methyl-accepting chemotaxis protein [Roseibium suaedae]|uniref:Methyl-accepting chemotaxis protein n=1 Tax=Roseibium suaedae TaxID=735517 RepID=A0A1M7N9B8_9HYPH|nr:methyl-accepting chemotaxis protein [Roseibium suaedae]SHN00201.1 methyl-accepting chemotaxis protein [Roseibium suaedae]